MRKENFGKLIMLSLLLQATVSCNSGQQDSSVPDYYSQIRGVMMQNGELSTGFIELTGTLFAGSDSEEAASTLQSDIIPLSNQLATAVRTINTTNPTIAATHNYLVEGWTQRQESYTEMLQAYRSSDIGLFESASEKADLARVNEERYFSEINSFLAPYGLYVTQHPE
jgi:hypothetical protein